MRRIDQAFKSIDSSHRREAYIGPLASTSNGGHLANVNNLYNSQIKGKTVMPYGISSRAMGGTKAQTIVNNNSDNVVVGVYDPDRPHVGVGEICLYSSGGCSVYLSASGEISIETGNSSIDVKKSGAIDITNSKGTVGIDTSGNVGITSSDYSVIVGLYSDESAEGGGENVDGISIIAEDAKATFDGTTGEIKITKEDTTGITISETNEVTIYKEETMAVISLTEAGDIALVMNEVAGVEIMNTEDINVYNSVASAKIGNDGKIEVDTTNDIKLTTSAKIEFKCTEFKVNDQTMVIP